MSLHTHLRFYLPDTLLLRKLLQMTRRARKLKRWRRKDRAVLAVACKGMFATLAWCAGALLAWQQVRNGGIVLVANTRTGYLDGMENVERHRGDSPSAPEMMVPPSLAKTSASTVHCCAGLRVLHASCSMLSALGSGFASRQFFENALTICFVSLLYSHWRFRPLQLPR